MISIIVERLPGDNQGLDIVDTLIATEVQAVERGRVEIDKQSTNRMIISGSCPMRPYMEPGKLVQISDLEQGNYIAMLRTYSFDIRADENSFSATTSVVLERSLLVDKAAQVLPVIQEYITNEAGEYLTANSGKLITRG